MAQRTEEAAARALRAAADELADATVRQVLVIVSTVDGETALASAGASGADTTPSEVANTLLSHVKLAFAAQGMDVSVLALPTGEG